MKNHAGLAPSEREPVTIDEFAEPMPRIQRSETRQQRKLAVVLWWCALAVSVGALLLIQHNLK